MHRVRTFGASFALRGGLPVSDTPFAFLNPDLDGTVATGAGLMLALVEPLYPAPGTGDAAAMIISRLRERCRYDKLEGSAQEILHTLSTENERLFHLNSQRALSERIHLGVTAVVVHGNRVTIAQTPPGHLLVRQGESIYRFPLRNGVTQGRARQHTPNPEPLGLRAKIQPGVYVTRADEGDLFVALSSDLARFFDTRDQQLRSASSVVKALEIILDASEKQFIATGHAALALIPPMMATHRSAERDVGFLEAGERDTHVIQESGAFEATDDFDLIDSQFSDTSPLDPLAPSRQTKHAHNRRTEGQRLDGTDSPDNRLFMVPSQEHGSVKATDRAFSTNINPPSHAQHESERIHNYVVTADDYEFKGRQRADSHIGQPHVYREWDDEKWEPNGKLPKGTRAMELLAGLILSLTAAVVGAWQVAKRDRPLHGPIDDGSFGLPRLQRWDESYRPPRMQRVRSRLPRLEVSRVVAFIAILLVIALGATYYVSRSASQAQQESIEALTLLQQAEAQRLAAISLPIPSDTYTGLLTAKSTLSAAEATEAAGSEELAAVRAAIEMDIARITRSQRLSNVQVVGGVPTAPQGRTSKLVSGGGGLYLLSDGIYQIDLFTGTLVQLLTPGDVVGGNEVGTLQGATWREDRLLTTDSTRSYTFDIMTGTWASEQLSTFDNAGHRNVAAVATFDRNLYLLTPESGQILKFQAGAYDGPIEDWTSEAANDELKLAVDLVIDGNVLVLLEDGRILDFLRSRLEATIVPQVIPPLERAVAIAAPVGSQYIYLLHSTDGRIVRMKRDGTVVQQFTAPVTGSVPILAGAMDLTVDEINGVMHVLANDTVYTVRLPAPPAE